MMNIRKTFAMVVCACSVLLWAQNGDALGVPGSLDPLNAVVRIDTCSYRPNYWMPWQDHVQNTWSGSGVVIAGNHILTNAHNLVYATYIIVTKQNLDESVEAHIKAIDHDCDLALLEVSDTDFFKDIQPFTLGDTPPPETLVSVAGYPIGGVGLSITQGVISRIELHFYVHSWHFLLAGQLDAAINPGNSGGPVVSKGRVVGIAFQDNRQGEGLGYMIPAEIIRHFLKDIEDGHVDGFGRLGFRYAFLENPDAHDYLKMRKDQSGVRIVKVEHAVKDILQLDDVLLSVDGNVIANNGNIRLKTGESRSFQSVITQKQIGETAELKLLRQGREITVNLPIQKIEYQCHGHLYDKLPEYYILGGFVFTTLSYSYLEEWGERNPPKELSDRLFMEKESPDQEVIVLSTVLANRVNKGYQNFASDILVRVNDKKIHTLKELIDYVESSTDTFITFYLGDDEIPVTLNLKKLRDQTPDILSCYRVPADRSKSLQK